MITHMNSIFARHGIPNCVMSDNGPQFSADIFSSFAKEYGFTDYTNSPRYPQADGEVKEGQKIVKEGRRKLRRSVFSITSSYIAILYFHVDTVHHS